MTIDLLNFSIEELNNTLVSSFQKPEFSILQLIDNFCMQIDQIIVYMALGILLMYISNLTLIPFFRLIVKDKKVKWFCDKLTGGLDGMGLMCAMYIVYMSYRQIGFDFKSWVILSIIISIMIFGNIYNLVQWIKKRRGNLEEKIEGVQDENKSKGDIDGRD